LVGKPKRRRPRLQWRDNIRLYLKEIGREVVDWNDLSEDKDKWWVVVNMVWTLGLHKMQGNSWLTEELLASQEGLSSM
jgi:hypothetical protein